MLADRQVSSYPISRNALARPVHREAWANAQRLIRLVNSHLPLALNSVSRIVLRLPQAFPQLIDPVHQIRIATGFAVVAGYVMDADPFFGNFLPPQSSSRRDADPLRHAAKQSDRDPCRLMAMRRQSLMIAPDNASDGVRQIITTACCELHDPPPSSSQRIRDVPQSLSTVAPGHVQPVVPQPGQLVTRNSFKRRHVAPSFPVERPPHVEQRQQ